MFNEEGIYIGGRYTVFYEGQLFYGDNNGLNSFETDSWKEVADFLNAYEKYEELDIYVKDNEYQVSWYKGEWY